jgi:hypothetical protein
VEPDTEYSFSDFAWGNGSPETWCVFVEAVKPSASAAQDTIRVEVDPDGPDGPCGYILWDTVWVTAYSLDLRVDSNNDGVIDSADDLLEDSLKDGRLGKFIAVNDDDDVFPGSDPNGDGQPDGNGIPDFADGFDFGPSSQQNPGEDDFVEMKIMLAPSQLLSTLPNATLVFEYRSSEPNLTESNGIYAAPPGVFRVWKKNGNVFRSRASAAETGDGDFVPADANIPLSRIVGPNGEATLFVEAIRPSVELDPSGIDDSRIGVRFCPQGTASWVRGDMLRLFAVGPDIDVDSDNTHLPGPMDPTSRPSITSMARTWKISWKAERTGPEGSSR